MSYRKFIIGLICLFFIDISTSGQQDGVRGGWLKSRNLPAQVNQVKPPVKQPGKTAKKPPKPPATGNVKSETLGIGYTLFMINPSGELVRVNTDHQFKSGDRISLLVEMNRNGYIYLFSQENDGPPRLLFPNTRIRKGNNLIEAHQTFWVPEEGEIEFDNRPAKERLIVVFSEEEIKNLPVSAKPEGEAVEIGLFRDVSRETTIRKGGLLEEGMLLTKGERQRGVRLNTKDPAPAFIIVNQNPAEKRIVANIQLTHR